MIFEGPSGYESRHRQKLTSQEVNAAEPVVPKYLRWSESTVSFGRSDHPEHVPHPGRFPLVVDPLVRDFRLTKVLMDGGSGIRPTGAPFHGVVPSKPETPLGQISLPVTFGNSDNFRTEVLTFEVVEFPGSYHAILGRPAYVKFMAIPNYVYLQLKMPGDEYTIPRYPHIS